MTSVKGRCPSCGLETLIVGSGGYIVCSYAECENRSAANILLERGRQNTRPSERTLGRLFEDEDGSVWRHVGYASEPTAEFELVDQVNFDRDVAHVGRKGGVVGSPILAGLRLLSPEPRT